MTVLAALGATLAAGCKKDRDQLSTSGERGRLRTISENLEEAYAQAPLPQLTEPASLAERVEKWDDFRSCTVRTYVARRREADRRMKEGIPRPARHASVGDETVEECAVQLAVAKKDSEICHRLAIDYAGPSGELPLAAARCWDTRARVFGLPDECPVIWLGTGHYGRNPECVAMARRDQSLCPFTESPGRCRALLTNDPGPCRGPDGADDCALALVYWRGLIPAGFAPPLVDPNATTDKPLHATFHLRWPKAEHETIRVEAPKFATALSWPAGKVQTGPPQESEQFWGFQPAVDAAQISWKAGTPAINFAFRPAGANQGVRPLQAPGPAAAATFSVVWTDRPSEFLRCQSSPVTQGEVRYEAGAGQPGSVVDGQVKGARLTCSDGSEMELNADFRAVILDVR
ncbi:MAG TPA: hypothetical protein VGG33_28535 [Polyangia bacterium]